MVCTLLAGVNVVAFAADGDASTVDVQKFYYDVDKGGNGEHIYTIDEQEIDFYKGEAAWNDEGTAWTAPVISNSPVYRVCNYNTGEHLWITDKGYVDYLVGLGWTQEQGIAFYSDDNKGTPVYRLWDGTDRVGSHHFSTNAEEISWLESIGWKNEGPQFYGVKEESAEVMLVDTLGLQSDGTALKTDPLAVVYGSDFGTPSAITWYKNGAVNGVYSGMTLNQGLQRPAGDKGVFYVVIENTKGQTFTTNSIIVVEDPAKATVSDFEVTEDYEHEDDQPATNIVYNAETNKLVATATVNRADYTGVFALLPTEKVLSGEAKLTDVVAAAPVQAGKFTKVNDLDDFTDANAIDAAGGNVYGICYEDELDGSVTYKWCVDSMATNATMTAFAHGAKLERGTSYTLGFCQDGIFDKDDLDTIVVGGFADAPYVKAPIGIQIANVSVTSPTKVDFQIGIAEMGILGPQKAEWMGNAENIGGTLDLYGSEDSLIDVEEEEYDDATTDLPAIALKGGMQGSLTKDANNDDNYFVAVLTLAEGIYGEDEIVLESEVAEPAQDAAVGLKATYNPADKNFDPYDIVATVDSSFRTSGTVELYRNTSKAAWADNVDLTDSDMATKVAEVEVEKGDGKATFDSAVTQLYKATGGNQYAVRFVPDDTVSWKTVNATSDCTSANATIANVIELPAILTLFETTWNPAEAATGTAIKVRNQFGTEIKGDLNPNVVTQMLPQGEAMKVDVVTAGSDIVPKVTIDAQKYLKVAFTTGTKSAVGDTYKLTLKNKQTVYAKVKTLNGDLPSEWTLWIE